MLEVQNSNKSMQKNIKIKSIILESL